MTAKDLEVRLPRDLSNSAIRAMLARLCNKRVLERRKVEGSHSPTDRRIPYVYSPAITPEATRKKILKDLARDHFNGSLLLVARTTMAVIEDEAVARPRRKRR